MKLIHQYLFTSILLLIFTSALQSAPKAFDSLGYKLETTQKECKRYLKDPNISKQLQKKCRLYNARVTKAFKVGYPLDASVDNGTASEKKLDRYLSLLRKADENREDLERTIRVLQMKKGKAKLEQQIKNSKNKTQVNIKLTKPLNKEWYIRQARGISQLKATNDRLKNDYYNSICEEMSVTIVQKLSDREYGINVDRKFSKLYTKNTSFYSKGRTSLVVYRDSHKETVSYKSGFSDSVDAYRECSREDKRKYLQLIELYSKASSEYREVYSEAESKYRKAKERAKEEAGCGFLYKKTNKGSISGSIKSILDNGFMIKKYYVNTAYASKKLPLSIGKYVKIIVKKTGKSRRFSLHELFPYRARNGESEYSQRALSHTRRYPSSKYKNLEEVLLVASWESLCK